MRYKTVEIMKGLSITGIVLLHAVFIELGVNNSLSNMLRLVAIKTLLFLSGFVIYGKVTKPGWVLEKIVRRIPMLFVFTFIYWLFGSNVVGTDGIGKFDVSLGAFYLYNIAIGFGGLVLWYIWTLILCYIVIYAFEKYSPKIKMPYLVKFWILVILINLIPFDSFGIGYLRWYGLFMFGGYAMRYVRENYKNYEFYFYKIVPFSLIIFPVFAYYFWNVISYSGQWINSGYVNIVKSIGSGEWNYAIIYAVLAILGVAFIYTVSKLISRVKYLDKFVILLGSATIGILLIHKMILEMKLVSNYWLSAIIALSISLILYYALKRNNILNYVLFGGTDIPVKLSTKLGGWYAKIQA